MSWIFFSIALISIAEKEMWLETDEAKLLDEGRYRSVKAAQIIVVTMKMLKGSIS